MQTWVKLVFSASALAIMFLPSSLSAAWKAEENWPINGGGYCRMVSPVGESNTGAVVMMVQMALDVQGLAFFFQNFPEATASAPARIWVDSDPMLEVRSRWNPDVLVTPFRVNNFIDEWPIFEQMFNTGSTFHLDYNGDSEPDVAISLEGAREAYLDWKDCLNRRE